MTDERNILLHDPRIKQAIHEFTSLISRNFPEATFTTYVGDDPVGIFLRAEVDRDDPDEVMDLIIDRLLTVQDEDGLSFYVLPVRTRERTEIVYARDHARFVLADASVAAIG